MARRARGGSMAMPLLIAVLLAAGIILTVVLSIALAAPSSPCSVRVERGLPGPDNAIRCTPGAFARLSHAQVCATKDRPTLRAADRREVLGEYGVPRWTGASGEIDHRVPLFLGGRTTPANLWPEPGAIPNAKDRLEFYVYRRVCQDDPPTMRVRTARRIFLGDWRSYYLYYGLDRRTP